MPSFKNLAIAVKRVHYGLTKPSEFLLSFVDSFIYTVAGKNPGFSGNKTLKRMLKDWARDDAYHLNNAKLPLLDKYTERVFLLHTMYDTYCSYLYFDDKYDEKTVDICDSFLGEGVYGLQNDKVDVTVEPGDIVIDAGSWIGDFAAYASVRGAAATYAFEPTDEMFEFVAKTAKLNPNIIAVKKGLSNEDVNSKAFYVMPLHSGSNTLLENRAENLELGEEVKKSVINTVTIDTFVKENNLERVDFIKADIEGAERDMLAGAQETLRKFAPKLALCTYHLPDDPEVMAGLIKKANPDYNIVQKKHKLYASVPKK